MEDTSGTAPASSGGEASSAPPSGVEAGSQPQASASAGSAPGGGVDAVVAGEATLLGAAASPAAQFSFLKRQFRDQKHAEEVFGSEVGMIRGVQRQNADLTKKVQALEAALSMRDAGVQVGVQGQGQNVPRGQEPPGEPKSFAEELAESKDLQLLAEMAEDPKIGLAGAFYHLTELMDSRSRKQLDSVREEITGEIQRERLRGQQHQAVAKAFGVVKTLATEYPELDEANQSDEAYQAQQGVLEILTARFTPEQIAGDPGFYIRTAAEEYRRSYGIPIFAQAPGTSGSPSVRAAEAAEAQASAAGAVPLEGSGVPRQRTNGQPESAVERIKRENREISARVARTPSGRPLGFEVNG